MKKGIISKLLTALLVVGLLFSILPSQQAQAATLDVCPTCAYTTIQAAIDDADTGDIINVAAGTYVEALQINKNITLLGPNADISPNTGTRNPEATILAISEGPASSYPGLGMIDLKEHDLIVTIKGFDFNLEDTSNQHYRYINVVNYGRSTLNVENNIFRNAPSNSNGYWWFTDAAGPHTVTILDNHFLNAAVSNGIQWGGNSFIVDIRDNVWEDNQGWAMNFNNATGTISGNKFIDRVDNGPSWAEDQCGILVAGSGNHLSVTGNTFDGLTSDAIGLGYGFASWLDISGNTFIGTRETVDEYLYVGSTSDLTNVSIKKNSFLLDIFDEFYPGSILVNLAENWWGNPAGPDPDSFIGPVSYIPWCANEECTEFAPPVYNQTLDTYHGTIQGAIDAAGVDNTILVSPGTYNEAITLNKVGLTVQSTAGPENTFINTPAGSTKAVGFADNLGTVTFEGFTVQNFTSAGIVQGFASVGTTVNIIDNIVNPSGYYTTNLIQVVGDGSVVSGNIITASGNPYPHHEGAGNTAIMVMNGSNITITNNVINGVLPDRLGLDQAIVIWNYSAPSGTPMSNIQITGNTVTNVNWLLNFIEQDGNHKVNLGSIEKNKFTDYNAIIHEAFPRDVSRNWWGSPTGPDTELFVGEGEIRYLPYCTDEDCTEFSKAKVYLTPETAEAACTDTEKDVLEVYVEDVAYLSAYEIQLNFDPSMIEILEADVVNGGFLDPSTGTGYNPDPVVIDAGVGTVTFNWVAQGSGDGLSKPSSGTGSLVKISYKRTGNLAGTASFTNLEVSLVGWEPGHEGENIEFDYTGQQASFTINPIVTNTSKIPNQGYCSLSTAVSGATSGDTLRADVDFDTTARVSVGKKIVFNTNGKTITRTNASSEYDSVFYVHTAGNLTVYGGGTLNSVSGTTDKFGAAIQIAGPVFGGAKVTLEEGTTLSGKYSSIYVYRGIFDMTGGLVTDGIAVVYQGRANISGGTVRGVAPIMGNGSANQGGTIITISGDAQIISDSTVAIYHPQNGTLNINGGTIIGTNAIEMKAGQLVVTDGTITGTGPFVETPTAISGYSTDTGDAILLFSAPGYTGDLSVDIQGGTITGENSYALREFTTETTTRTKSIEVSDGTLIGGLGTDNANEAVFFSTVDPLVLKLTGGRYNADPGDSPDYVFEPLDTYLHTDTYYHIQTILAGTIDAYTSYFQGIKVAGDGTFVDFKGDIPWYPADPSVGRTQGNRIAVLITEPVGYDPAVATLTIGANTYKWEDVRSADGTVDNWQKVITVPFTYNIKVKWNDVSEQTFPVSVLADSVLLAPPAPELSAPGLDLPFLVGIEQGFSVRLTNPATGATHNQILVHVHVDATTNPIEKLEYQDGDGVWHVLPLTAETGGFGVDFGPSTGFPMIPGYDGLTPFRMTLADGSSGAYPVTFTVQDIATGAIWNPLATLNQTVNVYVAPTISSTDIQGYYLTGKPKEFNVAMSNVGGPGYARMIFDYKVAGVSTSDITLFEYYAQDLDGWITVGSRPEETYGNCSDGTGICGQFGWAPGGFGLVPADFTNNSQFRITFANGKTDALPVTITLSGKNAVDDTEWKWLATFTSAIKAYTTPVITPVFPVGPYAAGVPVTVPVTITNPDGIPGPFALVLDLPEGTVISYGGTEYICTSAGCPAIPVVLALTDGQLIITFADDFSGDVTFTLYDTLPDPDRPIATAKKEGVVVGADYQVTGYFWLQGTSRRHDIPVIFTWSGTLATYGPEFPTEDTDTVNLTATLTYGGEYLITTNQPRYLNVAASDGKTIDVSGNVTWQPLRLLAGNAVWSDNLINVSDAQRVSGDWGQTFAADFMENCGDVNFDGKVNINDLALVGGNMGLGDSSLGEGHYVMPYASWTPVQ